VRARLIVLGVGYDLNSRLLDRLARGNHGQSEFVRPNENVESYVARLYQKIESPVMTDVAIDVSLDKVATDGSTAVNRVYPREVVDLFEGEQLVLVGRYKHAGNAKITVRGSVGGQTQSFDFPAELVEKSADDAQAFIEKLWAMRRVGEIIDELDLKGQNEELVKELVELSTRHGILTPYTSFLADETTRLEQLGVNLQRTNEALHSLDAIQGEQGVAQRSFKGSLKKADQASSASAPTAGPAAGGRSRRFSGLAAGGATTGPAPAAALVPGLATYRDAAKDEDVIVTNCRSVGTKAFFKRNGVWCDSTVTDEQIEKARKITQFSDEYFALAGTHGRRMSQYLVFDEPVVVSLEGDVVQIEPSAVITE
jgi:Ca-activated chloride channel family protein